MPLPYSEHLEYMFFKLPSFHHINNWKLNCCIVYSSFFFFLRARTPSCFLKMTCSFFILSPHFHQYFLFLVLEIEYHQKYELMEVL